MVDWKMLQSEMKVHAVDFVRKEAKEAAVLWLKEKGLPAAKEIAVAYIAALKESAEKETGWCRFRGCVFLPGVVQGGTLACRQYARPHDGGAKYHESGIKRLLYFCF